MRIPKIARHQSGQFRVRFGKKCFYLGHERDAAERRYRELLATHVGTIPMELAATTTIAELLERYVVEQLSRCDPRWRKSRQHILHQATRHAIEMYGKLPVSSFGPLAYQQTRKHMAMVPGRSRSYVNGLCGKLKQAFKWGVSQEIVRQPDYDRLLSVRGLEPGEFGLKDGREVQPVDVFLVERTLPYMNEQIGDIIRLLLLTGARPDEIVRLTPAEIERGETWIYHPTHHKTAKKNKRRAIILGTDAKAILMRYWPIDGFFFRGETGSHIRVSSVRNAVQRACKRARLPRWHPYQIRHRVLTDISLRLGREYAQAVGGHARATTTEHYDHGTIERAKKAVG